MRTHSQNKIEREGGEREREGGGGERERESERERERERQRETERDRERQRETERDREDMGVVIFHIPPSSSTYYEDNADVKTTMLRCFCAVCSLWH